MGLILPVHGQLPQWGSGCYIAPNATLTGDIVMGDGCSVWFQAVIRGDVNPIRIGNQTNIQDGAIVHGTSGGQATEIGSGVTVGHRAIVHGCTIEDDVLIGMGAIVLDKALVSNGCIVAAGAVVTESTRLEPGMLYAGIPARPVKSVSDDWKNIIARTAVRYPQYASGYGAAFQS